MGSGTMDEAQAWVEYCNGTGNTHWANLRRAHGHPEPYRVRYWGLGNEMYGSWQIGHLSPEDYVKKARAFALVMKRTDPDIQLIGCGHNGWSDWDQIVIDGLAPIIDWYSIHLYTGQADHYTTVFQSHQAERAIRICAALIERARYTQHLAHPISHRIRRVERLVPDRGPTRIGRAASRSATASATRWRWPRYLHGFIRHCRVVRMANLAQLVNADRADLHEPHRAVPPDDLSPAAPLRRAHAGGGARRPRRRARSTTCRPGWRSARTAASTASPTSGRSPSSTPSRPRDDGGRELTIGVVNRDRDRAHAATIDLGGAAATGELLVSEVNGPTVDATNSFEHPDRGRRPRAPAAGLGAPARATSSRRTRCSVLRVRLAS